MSFTMTYENFPATSNERSADYVKALHTLVVFLEEILQVVAFLGSADGSSNVEAATEKCFGNMCSEKARSAGDENSCGSLNSRHCCNCFEGG